MAVLFLEGFDMYNGLGTNIGLSSKWAIPGGSGQSMVTGRFGGQAWRLQPAIAQAIQRQFSASGLTTVTIGGAFRVTNLFPGSPSARSHVCFMSGTTGFQCGIIFDTGGSISALRISSDTGSTTLGTTAAGVMAANVWHYIEVEIVVSTTVGRITIYVDSVQKLNLTGQNTANLGVGTTVDSIRFASTNGGNGNAGFVDYDDIYILDAATKIGERRVETLRPNADVGGSLNWTPDTGTVHFSRVNATVAQSTTFVSASAVGNLDLYDIADLSSTPATIDAVQYNVFAMKTDAAARSIATIGDLAGVQQQSPDISLPSSVGKFEYLALTKPGGGAWTATDINALRIGPKVTV
jgi:hypothetical protein